MSKNKHNFYDRTRKELNHSEVLKLKSDYWDALKANGFPAIFSNGCTAIEMIEYFKRTIPSQSIGIYNQITVFEAANRIATDLVLINGVLKIFEQNRYKNAKVCLRLGNEHLENKGDFTFYFDENEKKIEVQGEAFNVAESFFKTKLKNTINKWFPAGNEKVNELLIVVNSEVKPLKTIDFIDKDKVKLVYVEDWKYEKPLIEIALQKFKILFDERYKRFSSLDLSEAEIRYDFCSALQKVANIESFDISLEIPFPPACVAGAGKQKLDMCVYSLDPSLSIEFGFFKRNARLESPIDDTGNAFKLLNDFVRVALYANYAKGKAYFICVADSKMLGRKLIKKDYFDAFPAKNYSFDYEKVFEAVRDYKTANDKMDIVFWEEIKNKSWEINAKLIFDEELSTLLNREETRVLAWEITYKIADKN